MCMYQPYGTLLKNILTASISLSHWLCWACYQNCYCSSEKHESWKTCGALHFYLWSPRGTGLATCGTLYIQIALQTCLYHQIRYVELWKLYLCHCQSWWSTWYCDLAKFYMFLQVYMCHLRGTILVQYCLFQALCQWGWASGRQVGSATTCRPSAFDCPYRPKAWDRLAQYLEKIIR